MDRRMLFPLVVGWVLICTPLGVDATGRTPTQQTPCPPSIPGVDATFWLLNATAIRGLPDRSSNPATRARLPNLRRLATSNFTAVLDNLRLGVNSTNDETTWNPWPASVSDTTQPFMANMTTWIYLPWDGRYFFDLIANDEASLIVNKASGGRAPLRSASAWRTLYGDTQTLVVRQTYDLVEGWYSLQVAYLKQSPTRPNDLPLLRLRWGFQDPLAGTDDSFDEDNQDSTPDEVPPQDFTSTMLFRRRASNACLDGTLQTISDLVDNLAAAPQVEGPGTRGPQMAPIEQGLGMAAAPAAGGPMTPVDIPPEDPGMSAIFIPRPSPRLLHSNAPGAAPSVAPQVPIASVPTTAPVATSPATTPTVARAPAPHSPATSGKASAPVSAPINTPGALAPASAPINSTPSASRPGPQPPTPLQPPAAAPVGDGHMHSTPPSATLQAASPPQGASPAAGPLPSVPVQGADSTPPSIAPTQTASPARPPVGNPPFRSPTQQPVNRPSPYAARHTPSPYAPQPSPYRAPVYPSPSPSVSLVMRPASPSPSPRCTNDNTTRLPVHIHLYPEDFDPQPVKQHYTMVQLQELANALPDARLWEPLLNVASELHLHLHPVAAHLEACKERWSTGNQLVEGPAPPKRVAGGPALL